VAAICAAPIALAAAGLLDGRKATCYPTFADQLGSADYQTTEVVVDGQVTTSRGPGTALSFALSLVRQLQGDAVATELGRKLLVAS
jgi:4-methyl-5(b-hydroxyethyl)-thiazole monophosphate biosynthesis